MKNVKQAGAGDADAWLPAQALHYSIRPYRNLDTVFHKKNAARSAHATRGTGFVCRLRRLAERAQRRRYFNSDLTAPLALPKSILPAKRSFSTPITLPISLGPAAPVSWMTAVMAALTSASLICLGR